MIRYQLVDQDNNTFDIDENSLQILEDTFSIEVDVIEKSFRAGADFPGIQRDSSKELNMQYAANHSTESEFRLSFNQFMYQLRKTRILRDIINNIQTEVLLSEKGITYDAGGFNLGASNSITFIQLRPFWEDINYNIVTESGLTSGLIEINNDGFIETPPIITLITENINQKVLLRILENNNGIVIKDLQFGTIGLNTYIIDNEDGIIELNEVPRNSKIQSGTGFFDFIVGKNTLQIQSDEPLEIEIKWKRRYYI